MRRRKVKFLDEYPELLKEWDYSLNTLNSSEVPYGTSKKVHWICEKGHKWVDSVCHRTIEHRSCPYCNNSKVMPGFNDLEFKSPELLKEWNFDKNEITPNNIYYKSTIKAWWKCPKCGNEYSMSPGDRNRGQGCPYCARKRVSKGVNDLATLFPNLASEWNYEKNGNFLPTDFSAHSDKKVWWKCKHGHEWEAPINRRTQQNKEGGCPVCSNKMIVEGINDLATTNPEVLSYWDFDKNSIKPNQISAGSNIYVWWKCEKGHSFRTQVYSFTHSKNGNNCPVCRNFKIVKGYNDLPTTNPELLKEWDYDRNKILPSDVHAGSKNKVWWKCKHGHEWEARINARILHNSGCPVCVNQKVQPGYNDVATLYPEIKEWWDYEKNTIKLADIPGTHSNKKAWFKCKEGHSFRSQIADFCSGKRCPVCANRVVRVGFNDLTTTHPVLAKEWDYEKNGDFKPDQITYGSDRKVWWKCERGHSWQAVISSRAAGRGCPDCSRELQSSLPEKTFYFYLKKYFPETQENVKFEWLGKRELDIYIPSLRLAVEYDGSNWHKNIKNDLCKDLLCEKKNIKIIRIREDGCKEYDSSSIKIKCCRIHGNIILLKDCLEVLFDTINGSFGQKIIPDINVERDVSKINELFVTFQKNNSLKANNPKLALEWNYEKNGDLDPSMISCSSNKKVWWKCERDHEWLASVASRNRGNGCPVCSNHQVKVGYNDLESKYPEIAKEWDYEKNYPLTPRDVVFSNQKYFWWKCKRGHSWRTTAYVRTINKAGCPICAGLSPEKGVNDLETLYPEIAKEWDYEKNYPLKPCDVLPGSEKKVWWICKHGHSYETLPRCRTVQHTDCPVCKNLKTVAGVNDLKTLHPELIDEWDYDKNVVDPSTVNGGGGSHKKYWWKCKHGHSWEASLASRIRLKTGCPTCAINLRKKK